MLTSNFLEIMGCCFKCICLSYYFFDKKDKLSPTTCAISSLLICFAHSSCCRSAPLTTRATNISLLKSSLGHHLAWGWKLFIPRHNHENGSCQFSCFQNWVLGSRNFRNEPGARVMKEKLYIQDICLNQMGARTLTRSKSGWQLSQNTGKGVADTGRVSTKSFHPGPSCK